MYISLLCISMIIILFFLLNKIMQIKNYKKIQLDLFILKECTFLVLTKSPSLFLAFSSGDFLKSVAPYLLITFSLTNLLYIKEAPLNCGNTNHATSASFMSYHIGIHCKTGSSNISMSVRKEYRIQ